MKSFVDYFMLANAEEIFLVRDKKMYHSGSHIELHYFKERNTQK